MDTGTESPTYTPGHFEEDDDLANSKDEGHSNETICDKKVVMPGEEVISQNGFAREMEGEISEVQHQLKDNLAVGEKDNEVVPKNTIEELGGCSKELEKDPNTSNVEVKVN